MTCNVNRTKLIRDPPTFRRDQVEDQQNRKQDHVQSVEGPPLGFRALERKMRFVRTEVSFAAVLCGSSQVDNEWLLDVLSAPEGHLELEDIQAVVGLIHDSFHGAELFRHAVVVHDESVDRLEHLLIHVILQNIKVGA